VARTAGLTDIRLVAMERAPGRGTKAAISLAASGAIESTNAPVTRGVPRDR
jgi:hypothetical protein